MAKHFTHLARSLLDTLPTSALQALLDSSAQWELPIAGHAQHLDNSMRETFAKHSNVRVRKAFAGRKNLDTAHRIAMLADPSVGVAAAALSAIPAEDVTSADLDLLLGTGRVSAYTAVLDREDLHNTLSEQALLGLLRWLGPRMDTDTYGRYAYTRVNVNFVARDTLTHLDGEDFLSLSLTNTETLGLLASYDAPASELRSENQHSTLRLRGTFLTALSQGANTTDDNWGYFRSVVARKEKENEVCLANSLDALYAKHLAAGGKGSMLPAGKMSHSPLKAVRSAPGGQTVSAAQQAGHSFYEVLAALDQPDEGALHALLLSYPERSRECLSIFEQSDKATYSYALAELCADVLTNTASDDDADSIYRRVLKITIEGHANAATGAVNHSHWNPHTLWSVSSKRVDSIGDVPLPLLRAGRGEREAVMWKLQRCVGKHIEPITALWHTWSGSSSELVTAVQESYSDRELTPSR
jgi:hypothetical protein